MTTDAMTPARAIRNAIRALGYEKIKAKRNGDDGIILTQYDEEMAALEKAIEIIKQHEALKAMLKAVVTE